jgi:hypothetical protein
MADPVERRAHMRQIAVSNQAILQFVSRTRYRRTKARLEDITPAGARILTDVRPALYEPIWVRIERPVQTDWVEARPVRYGAQHDVGVAFEKRCGAHFLFAATAGADFMDWLLDSDEQTPGHDQKGA